MKSTGERQPLAHGTADPPPLLRGAPLSLQPVRACGQRRSDSEDSERADGRLPHP